MPQIPKHRKVKRATVLLKRTQCIRNYSKYKSYKPLCEKLKNNNSLLAKALSKEKEEAQLLFSQNVALVAEVQDLGLACNKRDTVISNVLKNAKQMLEMLVTMTGYVTSTISMCQEFATCGTNLQIPSVGTCEPFRRLSTKAPARGVVKPMVSGHTITKPTINLNRINAQYINPSNLSIIEEVSTTPTRNEELNNVRSPIVVSAAQSPVRQNRCTGRTRRMPERLTVTSARNSDENERRLSKKSGRRSARMSGKHSKLKSVRLSGSPKAKYSLEFGETIGSPRVKLNDVSKLLQNSQSINIRMLTENQNESLRNSSDNNSDENRKKPQSAVTIAETSTDSAEEDTAPNTKNRENRSEVENYGSKQQTSTSMNKSVNNSADWDDPLEGPSWLLNDYPQNSHEDKDASKSSKSLDTTMTDVNNGQSTEPVSPLPILTKRSAHSQLNKKDIMQIDENDSSLSSCEIMNDSNLHNVSKSSTAVNEDDDECTAENTEPRSFPSFITQRRAYFTSGEDDTDDFTLMYTRQPRNMNFDINDLKLPVLEEPVIPAAALIKEPEPEITTTIQKITETCSVPFLPNDTMDESTCNTSTVRLPLLLNNHCKDITPLKERSMEQRRRNKKSNLMDSIDFVECSPATSADSMKEKKKKPANNKDPSAAKVVLQKLNESDVKQRTPTPDEICSSENRQYLRSPISSRVENSSDSESSNTSTNSLYNSVIRPRRKRAPSNLKEPNIRKKLRRNHC